MGWNPKYPEFATRPEGGPTESVEGLTTVIQDNIGVVKEIHWFQAPSTSHCDSFAYESFRPSSEYFSQEAKERNISRIHVRFKPTATKPMTHYAYHFAVDSEGRSIFDALKRAPEHPWADVGYPRLVLAKVLYDRLS